MAEAKPRTRRGAKRLTALELAEVSCVDVPANQGARALLFKNLAAVDGAPAGQADGDGAGGDPPASPAAAALAAELAATRAALAERDTQLAHLAERVAALTPDGGNAAGQTAGGNAPPQQEHSMTEPKPGGTPPAGDDVGKAAQQEMIDKAVKAAVEVATADLKKRAETAEARAEDAVKAANAEKAARELAELTKAAEGPDFGNLPGDPLAKAKALHALRDLADEPRGVIEAALKAGNAAMARSFREVGKTGDYGFSGGTTSGTGGMTPAEAELDAKAREIATAKGMPVSKAYAEAVAANPGLYDRYKTELRQRARDAA